MEIKKKGVKRQDEEAEETSGMDEERVWGE